ncbi:MAG TPA: hypothetical protein GX702_16135 [Chloroflexi bacterium]|nr:hypothetical protein [Chloroflexota bacterium]
MKRYVPLILILFIVPPLVFLALWARSGLWPDAPDVPDASNTLAPTATGGAQTGIPTPEQETQAEATVTPSTESDSEPTIAPPDPIPAQASTDHPTVHVDLDNIIGAGPRYYGVEYSWTDQDEALFIERYRILGANTVRVQLTQDLFEPVNDNDDPNHSEIDFSITAEYDAAQNKTLTYERMLKALIEAFPDMHFHINMWLAARWNAAEPEGYMGLGGAFPPRDYAEHREFVRETARWLVDACGIPPEQISFSFVNEPNLPAFFVGTGDDLMRMAAESRAALDEISPSIQMGGLDEVHGTSWTEEFAQAQSPHCCDMWTFHAYEHGLTEMENTLQQRIGRLRPYGPVWVTEFADTRFGSPDARMDLSGRDAAIGLASMLGRIWPAGIDGVAHFRLSDTYVDRLGGWVGHGLFADRHGTRSGGVAFEPYPSFWVFSNLYNEFGGGSILHTSAPAELSVFAVRHESGDPSRAAIWLTNPTANNLAIMLSISALPDEARITVLDNLAGRDPFHTETVSGPSLAFETILPPHSSYSIIIH